ncbi:DMT family transporter [Patescibacteria group bacterium]|nr:DMT family transporter [Patescibacteria group bacterium]
MHTFIPAKVMLWQGYVLVIVGAVFLAYWTVGLKKLVDKKSPVKDVPPDAISAINFLGTGIVLLVASLLFNPPDIWSWFAPNGLFWPLMATSLLNIVIMYGIGRSLKGADASLIAPIGAFGPLISILPSWLILGEVPTTYGYTGLVLMFLGVYAMAFAERKKVKIETVPDWLKTMDGRPRLLAPLIMLFKGNKQVVIALAGAVCGAVSVNFDKLAAMRSSPIFAAAFIMIFIGLVGLLKTWKTGELKQIKKLHAMNLALGALSLAAVLVLFWLAFNYGLAIYVSALKRTNTVFTLIFAYFLLGEKKELMNRLLGIAFILAGAVLLGF